MQTKEPWQALICGVTGSVVADANCTPLEVIKVRLHLSRSGLGTDRYAGILDCVRKISRQEGVRGFFKGLSPALLRAGTYGGARLGFYEPIKKLVAGDVPKNKLGIAKKFSVGLSSGALAALLFNPCDVLKVRMQGGGTNNPRYASMLQTLRTIVKEERLRGLYKGATVNVTRGAIISAVQLATYDVTKHAFIASPNWPRGDSLATHLAAAMVSGMAVTVASNPVDVIKTRLMTQGALNRYQSPIHCVLETYRAEGARGFLAGFWPSYLRIGPHTVVIFIVYEQLRARMGWAG